MSQQILLYMHMLFQTLKTKSNYEILQLIHQFLFKLKLLKKYTMAKFSFYTFDLQAINYSQ